MDKEFIGIVCGIIGLLATGSSSGVRSKLRGLIFAAIGIVALCISSICLGHPYAIGFVLGGIIIWGSSFMYTKIRGEDVFTGVNWLTFIVGTLVAILGWFILNK